MENEKSPNEVTDVQEKEVLFGDERMQEAYIPHFSQTEIDTRSKTCGIAWKLHRAEKEASDDVA